jgi:hypothetical protein
VQETAEPSHNLVMLPRVTIVSMPSFDQEILIAERPGVHQPHAKGVELRSAE